MSKPAHFLPYEREQPLLPQDMYVRGGLPIGGLAYAIQDAVATLDLPQVHKS